MDRETNPTDLIAQEAAAVRDATARRLNREAEAEDFKWLMSQKQGRRFAWRILSLAGVFRSTFRLDNEMAFLEGMRNMGLIVVADINELCPEKYNVMVSEQKGKHDNRSNH